MTASTREQVVAAVVAMLDAGLVGATVKRNGAKPQRIPPGGLVIVRDGDPGDPEVLLSPLTKIYDHRLALEIAPGSAVAGDTPEAQIDTLSDAILALVQADRTLGGRCDFLDYDAAVIADLDALGAEDARWADAAIVATYATP